MRLKFRAVAAIVLCAVALACVGSETFAQTTQPTTQPTSQPKLPLREEVVFGPPRDVNTCNCWLDQIKKPVPWLQMGGDLRLREQWSKNVTTLNNGSPATEQHYQRYRTRLWTTITPIQDVEVNVRATWEFYNFCLPASASDSRRDTNFDEVVFDTANVKWKNTFGLPNNLQIGRQDFLGTSGVGETGFSDGWLIGDGTPLDGSRTNYFDAVRDTLLFKDITSSLDLVYINQAAHEDDRWEPFNTQYRNVTEQDEQGAIVWFKNKSLKTTQFDAYFIYKNEEKYLSNGDNADIYTFGGKVDHEFDQHWRARGELAGQFGNKNGDSICAMAANTRLTYSLKDAWDQSGRLGYEYLSGDDPDTKKNEGFDVLWGRWAYYSDTVAYLYAMESRVAQYTNLHRVYAGWTLKPAPPIEILLDYHLLFAPQNVEKAGFSEEGCFRGQLLTALLKYKFSPHLSGHLVGEAFFPGDFYTDSKNDPAFFVRYELVFSW